ncbi:HAMP domain-containing histidine kinase [Pseudolysobacter antarcticus]|uniref:histidine kinase n=1 Tax=Pseudolysobacter antarcticus TaxID=2511995 RepID=A0A411HJL4_9GAMM|nr:HAMP domain-containing sensor histidine kinase [Pseudolysobacter antarcticus]QBB70695.1 HAMP domain-containing histidine kinase [Pseudolysobacter antarcticus]
MLEHSIVSLPVGRLGGKLFPTLYVAPLAPIEQPSFAEIRDALAALAATHRETEDLLKQSDQALLDAGERASMRERFIGVLGHDLRNSLQSIGFGTYQLRQTVADAPSTEAIAQIERSCGRMTELVQNILDFVRGRLGGGIPLSRRREDGLADELRHVVTEVQLVHADRDILSDINIAFPVTCDRRRLAQLLANLLTNAVTHGVADQPVKVRMHSCERMFEMSVTNGGPAIPVDRLAGLFEPFSHRVDNTQHSGLGLGLYIAAEISRSHGGTLTVSSLPMQTCFTFRMPMPTQIVVENKRVEPEAWQLLFR